MYLVSDRKPCVHRICPTKRAPDWWESARFRSIFLASGFSCSQAESTPAHTQVTQTVGRLIVEREMKMSWTRIILVHILIILLLLSCSFGKKSEHENMSEIYSEVMAYGFSNDGGENIEYCKDGNLTVSSITQDIGPTSYDWQKVNGYFPQLERETWDNFLEVNSRQIPFPSDLDLGCQYTPISTKHYSGDPAKEKCLIINWFSQIGFNSRKDEAVVYYSRSCYFHDCNALYFAELIDNNWVVTDLDEVICS